MFKELRIFLSYSTGFLKTYSVILYSDNINILQLILLCIQILLITHVPPGVQTFFGIDIRMHPHIQTHFGKEKKVFNELGLLLK